MLAIRLQRTGRSGHAQFRLIAQDSRFSPTSGRVVEYLGSYDPHTKTASINKDKTADFLKNGAQPSPRAAKLLKAEGVKLPSWVAEPAKKKRDIRNLEKLRRNRPVGAEAPKAEAPPEEAAATEAPAAAEAVADKPVKEAVDSETPVTEESPAQEAPAEEKPKEEPVAEEAAAEPEAPAEETPAKSESASEDQK